MAYPRGFYPVVITGRFHFFEHNHHPEPEMNFNEYIYFYRENSGFTTKEVEVDILRCIVAKLEDRQCFMNKMMMVNEAGTISPAHLPVTSYVVALREVQSIIERLEVEPIVYEGTTPIILKLLLPWIDPKPFLPRAGPIYTLGPQNLDCGFGCYIDKFLFAQVHDSMTNINFTVLADQFMKNEPPSRYHEIKLTPEEEDDKADLSIGSSIVLWNARRLTRPSFVPHFREIVATHNPILMIVTEIGAQAINCERQLKRLGTTMAWKVDEGNGLTGGTVVFWDPARVQAEILLAESSAIDLRIVGTVRALED